MNKRWIRPVVVLAVFIGALVTFSFLMNQVNEDLTTSMAEASIPVVSFYHGDTRINELHGYAAEMDVTSMRDSITPVSSERLLPMEISTYGADVEEIFYEIRSMDGSRLIADSQVEDYEQKERTISATLKIQNLLTEEQEYNLILRLTAGEKTYYYYTRIMQTDSCYVEECLEFALKFHDYTFREDASEFIPTYMDPATGDATTLNYVDLTCTLNQVTWASFEGQVLTEPVVSLKEINSSYDVVVLQYVLSSVNDYGETEYYNIEEYYRLRYTTTRMYVLNFERTMNQIFRGENTFLTESGNLLLGIRSSEVEYEASEAGDFISFVQEGDLWCYDVNENTMIQIYSFRSAEGMDARENWDQHDIKIVGIDEAGSVDFIVYGYMNRGDHEGEVGMGIYHYDGIAHTVEEAAFLPSADSYEILKAEMGQLMYQNDTEMIYLMMEGNVYRIDLETLEVEIAVSGLIEGNYAVSDSNRYIAWVEETESYSAGQIHVMDFRSGNVFEIEGENGNYVRPLGFAGEDFIYGTAAPEHVSMNAAGNMVFPMDDLRIVELQENGFEVLKEFSKSGRYIESVSVSGTTITVNLLKESGGQFAAAGTDSIMNREADTQGNVSVGTIVTEAKETQVQLQQTRTIKSTRHKRITSKIILLEEPRILSIQAEEGAERFYVYVKGDVLLATESISDAIRTANEGMGVVVDDKQQYVWMRARKNSQSAFSGITPSGMDGNASAIVKCISAMLSWNGTPENVSELAEAGATPKEILEEALEERTVLDLTGCTVEEIVYYVSCQSPVFAVTGTDQAVLITGYTSDIIYYYDPVSGTTKFKGIEDAEEWFESAGSVFLTYL